MEKLLFKEEQRHNQWWLWMILIASLLAVIGPFSYGIYSQEVLDKPYGDNPMNTEGLIVFGLTSTAVLGFVIFLMMSSRLKTKISNGGISYCYPPLAPKWKFISPAEIERFEIRTFRAVREFGGYGIKRRWRRGAAYIISGNTGLQLYLKNGKKLLIGTQKKQAIEYAMQKIMEQDKG